MKMRLALVVVFTMLSVGAQASGSNLGTIDFPNSGARGAQNAFVRAVLLLHSFEYDDLNRLTLAESFDGGAGGVNKVELSYSPRGATRTETQNGTVVTSTLNAADERVELGVAALSFGWRTPRDALGGGTDVSA
ncbi:MAG: hypothetical protein ACE5IK_13415, partial [Acidobacteriota bacterium]